MRATAADTRVAFIAETTPGTTPATPAFTILRATGESLEVGRKLAFSSELDGLRGEKNFAVAAHMASGGVNFEWTDGTLDPFLESALRAAWNSGVLIDAKTAKAFSIEVTYEQGATDTFKRVVGAEVATFGLDLRAGEIATGSMSFMGRGSDYSQTGITGATYAAGNAEPILVGADVGSLSLGGVLTIDAISSITFNLTNNLRERMKLGALAPDDIGAGKLEVTGALTMYLDSGEYDVLRAFADGTSAGLSFTIGNATGKKTTFECPNIILSDLRTVAESAEGDVMLSVNWRALQSSTLSGGVVRVTRDVA